MPQLDTSTWLTTIFSMLITLFIVMQLKVSKHLFLSNPEPQPTMTPKHTTPWETKWTKIYSPLSLTLQ